MFISFLYCTFYYSQAHSPVSDLQTYTMICIVLFSLFRFSLSFIFFYSAKQQYKLKCLIGILIIKGRSSFRSFIDKTLETMGICYHLHSTQCAKKQNRKKHELMTQLRQSSTDCFCKTVAFFYYSMPIECIDALNFFLK